MIVYNLNLTLHTKMRKYKELLWHIQMRVTEEFNNAVTNEKLQRFYHKIGDQA